MSKNAWNSTVQSREFNIIATATTWANKGTTCNCSGSSPLLTTLKHPLRSHGGPLMTRI